MTTVSTATSNGYDFLSGALIRGIAVCTRDLTAVELLYLIWLPAMRASTHQSSFRVFLSSPGDVKAEREAAERVVRRIGGIYAAHVDIVLERWEGNVYQATAGFQEQIEATSAFDLVVGILWKRIGTELPPDLFRRPDGAAFESGTVLELESALEASAARGGKPVVFVFRKNAEILFSKGLNFPLPSRRSIAAMSRTTSPGLKEASPVKASILLLRRLTNVMRRIC